MAWSSSARPDSASSGTFHATNAHTSTQVPSQGDFERHTAEAVSNAVLSNNRGCMWINEGFYDRAVDSMKQALEHLDPSRSQPHDVNNRELSSEQERLLCEHLVMHVPHSKCHASVLPMFPGMQSSSRAPLGPSDGGVSDRSIDVYSHPVNLGRFDTSSRPIRAPRSLLEFNTALSCHLHGDRMLTASHAQSQLHHSMSSSPLQQQQQQQPSTALSPVAALDHALQLYMSFVNRYCTQQQQQQQQQQQSQLQNQPHHSFLQYFLALASLNNMGHIYMKLLGRRAEAMQCGVLLNQLHSNYERQRHMCCPLTGTERTGTAVDGQPVPSVLTMMQTLSMENRHREQIERGPPANRLGSFLEATSPCHGMVPYLCCFLKNAQTYVLAATVPGIGWGDLSMNQSAASAAASPLVHATADPTNVPVQDSIHLFGVSDRRQHAVSGGLNAGTLKDRTPASRVVRQQHGTSDECWECLGTRSTCTCRNNGV